MQAIADVKDWAARFMVDIPEKTKDAEGILENGVRSYGTAIFMKAMTHSPQLDKVQLRKSAFAAEKIAEIFKYDKSGLFHKAVANKIDAIKKFKT